MDKIVKTDRWRAAESAAREAIAELFAARMEAREAQGFYDDDEPIDGLTMPQRMQNAFPLGFTASVVWQDLNAEDAEHSVVGAHRGRHQRHDCTRPVDRRAGRIRS